MPFCAVAVENMELMESDQPNRSSVSVPLSVIKSNLYLGAGDCLCKLGFCQEATERIAAAALFMEYWAFKDHRCSCFMRGKIQRLREETGREAFGETFGNSHLTLNNELIPKVIFDSGIASKFLCLWLLACFACREFTLRQNTIASVPAAPPEQAAISPELRCGICSAAAARQEQLSAQTPG